VKDFKDLKLLFSSSDSTGCGWYRSYLPFKSIAQQIPNTVYTDGFDPRHECMNSRDIYICQRVGHEYFLNFIPVIQQHGKKFVYDLDDNLWNIPSTNAAHTYYNPAMLKLIGKIISISDCVTVSTEPLAEYIREHFNKNVFIVSNFIEKVYNKKIENEKPIVGWAGTHTHKGDFNEKLVKYLHELHKSKKAKLVLYGYTPYFLKNIVESHEFTPVNGYLDYLQSLNIDIGLIITEDNLFNKCKSNLKYLEYSSVGITSIADDVYPYSNTIDHLHDGLIVKNQKHDWREYIEYLIESSSARLEMQNNSKEKIKQFTYADSNETFLNKYKEVFKFLGETK